MNRGGKENISRGVTNWMSLEVAHSFIFLLHLKLIRIGVRSAVLEKTTQTASQRTCTKLQVGASEGQLFARTLRTQGSGLWNSGNEGRLEMNVFNAKQE